MRREAFFSLFLVISKNKKGKIKKKRKPDTQVIIEPAVPSVRLLIRPIVGSKMYLSAMPRIQQ